MHSSSPPLPSPPAKVINSFTEVIAYKFVFFSPSVSHLCVPFTKKEKN